MWAITRTGWTDSCVRKPPHVQAVTTNTATAPTAETDARMLRMPNSTSGPAFAKVKRARTGTAGSRIAQFALAAVWLTSCVHTDTLDAAVARAQARLVAACGLEAAPSSVRWVRGYIPCGASTNAIGCTDLQSRAVTISRAGREDLDWIVLHELLHVLGASHIPAGHGVMGADASSAVRKISAEDLAPIGCPHVHPEG